eukprot:3023156-Amphidinium_carterae.1
MSGEDNIAKAIFGGEFICFGNIWGAIRCLCNVWGTLHCLLLSLGSSTFSFTIVGEQFIAFAVFGEQSARLSQECRFSRIKVVRILESVSMQPPKTQLVSTHLVSTLVMVSTKIECSKLAEYFNSLLNDEVMTESQTTKFWKADGMIRLYDAHAPEWTQVKNYVDISQSSLYHSDVADDSEVLYVHGTSTELEKGLKTGCLGMKYCFTSPFQAIMHRMTHHHYKLSGEGLESGYEVVVGISMSQEIFSEVGCSRQNGYCTSIMAENLKVSDGLHKPPDPRVSMIRKRAFGRFSAQDHTVVG